MLGQRSATSPKRAARQHNFDVVAEVVAERVGRTSARISAKRLLPEARAAGYAGSARNFRRLVARAKRSWRSDHHRGRRPGVWAPGEVLVIDWGVEAGLHVFCAVMAFSRWRFVRFAADERAATTLEMLARCFEALGGVPKVVLADRMGCLKGGVVANIVVPTPAYVRFASHYGFRPDFCEAADPEPKGIVEALVGYAKSDLVVPDGPHRGRPERRQRSSRHLVRRSKRAPALRDLCRAPYPTGGRAAAARRPPVATAAFGRVFPARSTSFHCVRFGSARYSVPTKLIGRSVELQVVGSEVRALHFGEVVATHELVAPGEASVKDEHYGGPRHPPRRTPRPRTAAERAICALGEVGEAFIKAAAAAGVTKLGSELEELVGMEAAHGREALVAALSRALEFSRYKAADVRSVLAAGTALPSPSGPGEALVVDLPKVPTRSLADYATDKGRAS